MFNANQHSWVSDFPALKRKRFWVSWPPKYGTCQKKKKNWMTICETKLLGDALTSGDWDWILLIAIPSTSYMTCYWRYSQNGGRTNFVDSWQQNYWTLQLNQSPNHLLNHSTINGQWQCEWQRDPNSRAKLDEVCVSFWQFLVYQERSLE